MHDNIAAVHRCVLDAGGPFGRVLRRGALPHEAFAPGVADDFPPPLPHLHVSDLRGSLRRASALQDTAVIWTRLAVVTINLMHAGREDLRFAGAPPRRRSHGCLQSSSVVFGTSCGTRRVGRRMLKLENAYVSLLVMRPREVLLCPWATVAECQPRLPTFQLHDFYKNRSPRLQSNVYIHLRSSCRLPCVRSS